MLKTLGSGVKELARSGAGASAPHAAAAVAARADLAHRLIKLRADFQHWSEASSAPEPVGSPLSRRELWALQLVRDEALTPSSLAQRLRLGAVGATRLVDRLEGLGWIRRTDDPRDRRRVPLVITEQGRAASRIADEAAQTFIVAQMETFSDEEIEDLRKGIALLIRLIVPRYNADAPKAERNLQIDAYSPRSSPSSARKGASNALLNRSAQGDDHQENAMHDQLMNEGERRHAQIRAMRAAGKTLREIGACFGLSAARISVIALTPPPAAERLAARKRFPMLSGGLADKLAELYSDDDAVCAADDHELMSIRRMGPLQLTRLRSRYPHRERDDAP